VNHYKFLFNLIVLLLSAQHLLSQSEVVSKGEDGFRFSKHSIGYAFGYAYPKLADGSKNTSVSSGFNYGFSGAFEWGKHYDSGISFTFTPTVYYYNVDNSVIKTNSLDWSDEEVIFSIDRFVEFDELLFYLPISYEFPLSRSFRFGGGINASFPLIGEGSSTNLYTEYQHYIPHHGYVPINPPKQSESYYEVEYNFEMRLGISGKLLYTIRANKKSESYLGLEYWYDISLNGPFNAHVSRFALVFTHRYLQVKEVREKWDRYLIQKDRKN